MMAVWTPGSYLIREYERHVEGLTAFDAARVTLAVEKTRKNRWRVATNGSKTVWLRYRVYAHEMTVRTNWVDEELAMLNGAPTFVTLLERPSRRAHEVRLNLPRTWAKSFSGLPAGPGNNSYIAPDYDTLVDSPILAGSPSVYEFSVRDSRHYLVNFRERGVWNGPQAAKDLAAVASTIAQFWGDVPFDRYYFFNVIGSTRNGLEHRNSTLMNIPLDSTKTRARYLEWLSLASHEYFHAWNVKRLRPVELGPFDYENEVYTSALWFVEGLTDYYADLFMVRAGVATRDEFFTALSDQIRSLQTTPGRFEQSVEAASYDAWIKYYRADENTPNTAISYYVKGAIIGFLLDAHIRRLTNGAKSLDDVMRVMRTRFSGDKGFSREDVRDVVAEVAGAANAREIRVWLARVLETTVELDYDAALDWFGLRITPPRAAPRAYLGVTTRADNDNAIVTGIRRGSPAAAAGLSLLDEIEAINGQRLSKGDLAGHLERFAPGAKIELSLVRRGEERRVDIVLATDPAHGWQLSISPGATPTQRERVEVWVSP
jgi:predicted metalloprotease with PDZ domain